MRCIHVRTTIGLIMKFLNNVNLKRVYVLLSIFFAVFVCGWLINHFHQQNDFVVPQICELIGLIWLCANFKTFLLMRGNNSGYFDVSGKVILDT